MQRPPPDVSVSWEDAPRSRSLDLVEVPVWGLVDSVGRGRLAGHGDSVTAQ